jgi:hypothetical protein
MTPAGHCFTWTLIASANSACRPWSCARCWGSPYASLMEPQARYRLHDAIQQQLGASPHYVVHYTLHTSDGQLSLMELGEAYKQHNRHLLRGYLLVVDGLFSSPAPMPTG